MDYKFLSQKTKIAIKQLQQRILNKSLENEKHFRLHILWNLAQQSTSSTYDPQFYNTLLRQYPCDCIQHRIRVSNCYNNMLHEDLVAVELDDFCKENNLFDRSNRYDLLNLYNFISSAFFTFQDLTEKYHVPHLDNYIEWCRKVSMKNFALHQQLAKETIDYEQHTVQHLPPRPLPRELLRTQDIIDRQLTIGMEMQNQIVSKCILPQTRKMADNKVPNLRPHITKMVKMLEPDSSTHCISSNQAKLERAILINQADDLDNEELEDISTLQREFEEIDCKYQKLLEQKKVLQSQIAQKKQDFKALTKTRNTKIEEFNFNSTKLETYRDIISKNTVQLNRVTEENNEIKHKLDLIHLRRRQQSFSNRMKHLINS